MAEITNKFLVVLVVVATIFSVFSTMTLLNGMARLRQTPALTGKAQSGTGNVTLTVVSSVSIRLNNAVIDFGIGYVNSSKNTVCGTNATLQAGPIYNDTGGNDCWTDLTKTPGPFLIENDGNVNVTVNVTGPTEQSFFSQGGAAYPGTYPYNITWRARENETGVCNNGLQAAWDTFGGRSKIVCNNMDYQPSNSDEIAVDVLAVVPTDLPSGTYENSSIEFSAVAA